MKITQSHPYLPQTFYVPTVIVQLGGGGFKAMPGKPVEWVSAKQLADEFGMSWKSIYRWRENGTIPTKYAKRSGPRRWKFHASVIAFLRVEFEKIKTAENPGAMHNLKRR